MRVFDMYIVHSTYYVRKSTVSNTTTSACVAMCRCRCLWAGAKAATVEYELAYECGVWTSMLLMYNANVQSCSWSVARYSLASTPVSQYLWISFLCKQKTNRNMKANSNFILCIQIKWQKMRCVVCALCTIKPYGGVRRTLQANGGVELHYYIKAF